MAAHNDLFHGPARKNIQSSVLLLLSPILDVQNKLHISAKPFNLGKSTILKEPMFSVGGFSTTSGNKMAKHLGEMLIFL